VGRSLLILLDTHVVIWLAFEESRIAPLAQAAIQKARQSARGIAISDFTLFELSLLFRKKQFRLAISPETFLREVEHRFPVFPVTANIALQAYELPANYPNDPVDRIIGATALIEDIPLVTADREIRRSRAVPTIW
jgi:PIN domain nuclease of toxin-antitoxin system